MTANPQLSSKSSSHKSDYNTGVLLYIQTYTHTYTHTHTHTDIEQPWESELSSYVFRMSVYICVCICVCVCVIICAYSCKIARQRKTVKYVLWKLDSHYNNQTHISEHYFVHGHSSYILFLGHTLCSFPKTFNINNNNVIFMEHPADPGNYKLRHNLIMLLCWLPIISAPKNFTVN